MNDNFVRNSRAIHICIRGHAATYSPDRWLAFESFDVSDPDIPVALVLKANSSGVGATTS